METENIELQVAKLAMSKTLYAIKACRSPLFLALVKDIDTGNFYHLDGTLEGIFRTLRRYEENQKIDNKEYLRLNTNIIKSWSDRAKARSRDDFTLLLEELIYILLSISEIEPDHNVLLGIYEFYLGNDDLPKSINLGKNPAKIKLDKDLRNAIHNERLKLGCNLLNTISAGIIMGGSLLPIVALSFPLASSPPSGQVTLITAGVWAFVATGIHWTARTLLGSMQQ